MTRLRSFFGMSLAASIGLALVANAAAIAGRIPDNPAGTPALISGVNPSKDATIGTQSAAAGAMIPSQTTPAPEVALLPDSAWRIVHGNKHGANTLAEVDRGWITKERGNNRVTSAASIGTYFFSGSTAIGAIDNAFLGNVGKHTIGATTT